LPKREVGRNRCVVTVVCLNRCPSAISSRTSSGGSSSQTDDDPG